MAAYMLLAGTHTEGGVRYDVPRGAAPVRVVSDQPLDEKYPNKFQLVEGPRLTTDAPNVGEFIGRPAPVVGSREPQVLRVVEDEATESTIQNPMSQTSAAKEEETAADVTADFPTAADYGLRVVRRRNGLVLLDQHAGRGDAVLTTASSKTQMERAIQRAVKTRLPAGK